MTKTVSHEGKIFAWGIEGVTKNKIAWRKGGQVKKSPYEKTVHKRKRCLHEQKNVIWGNYGHMRNEGNMRKEITWGKQSHISKRWLHDEKRSHDKKIFLLRKDQMRKKGYMRKTRWQEKRSRKENLFKWCKQYNLRKRCRSHEENMITLGKQVDMRKVYHMRK